MNWFSSGFSGIEESVAEKKAEYERLKKQPRRVMLKVGESAKFIFLDDIAFTYDEHKIVPPGPEGWKNTTFRTCIGATRGCPDCADGIRATRMVAFTVIDRRSWLDKEGKQHQNERRLLVLRDDIAIELKKKMLTWGGLKSREIIISRVGERSPSSGNSFDIVRNADHQPVIRNLANAKAQGIEIEPYDYADILAPIYKSGSNAAKSVALPSSSSPFGDMDSDNPFDTGTEIPSGEATVKSKAEDDIPFDV